MKAKRLVMRAHSSDENYDGIDHATVTFDDAMVRFIRRSMRKTRELKACCNELAWAEFTCYIDWFQLPLDDDRYADGYGDEEWYEVSVDFKEYELERTECDCMVTDGDRVYWKCSPKHSYSTQTLETVCLEMQDLDMLCPQGEHDGP